MSNDKKEVEHLRKVQVSMNQAATATDERIANLEKENAVLKAKNANAQQAADIQKAVTISALTEHAASEAKIVAEIQELQAENRALRAEVKALRG